MTKIAITKSSFLFDEDMYTLDVQDVLTAFEGDPRFIRISKHDFIGKELTELAALVKITKSKSMNS